MIQVWQPPYLFPVPVDFGVSSITIGTEVEYLETTATVDLILVAIYTDSVVTFEYRRHIEFWC